jgi:hypothetical protein
MVDCVTNLPNDGKNQPQGLSQGGKITHMLISNTLWTKVPAIALARRNSIKFINRSETATIYIEFVNTNPVGDGDGIPPGGNGIYDATDDIFFYACATVNDTKLTIVEIA